MKKIPLRVFIAIIGFLGMLLNGCQTGPVADAKAVQPAAVPSPTRTLPPPAIKQTNQESSRAELPSFNLIDPLTLPTATTDSPNTPVPTVQPHLEVTETATPAPQPTFTPPTLPLTSPDEHYWLRRPVPDGGTVWTDKVYPYGSTRGGTLQPHHGVEFYVPTGTQILAAASGTVRFAGSDSNIVLGPHINFYGNLVVIEHESRWNNQAVFTLYGHLSSIVVYEGQQVSSQEIIAYSGASGVADGPHLHFEVRVGQNSYGNTRNPLLWLYPFPDFGTVAGRVIWPDGRLAEQVPISLNRIDAPSRYLATTSYAGSHVNPDDNWQENFAIDDVPSGYYEITVNTGEKKHKQELWVFPYQTSFVEIILGN